jgi:hypothetical protein
MMHQGALRIYEETKGMTVEEELAYWKRRSEAACAKPEHSREARNTHGASVE